MLMRFFLWRATAFPRRGGAIVRQGSLKQLIYIVCCAYTGHGLEQSGVTTYYQQSQRSVATL